MTSKRDFDEWFSHFRRTIYGYSYYVDFNKVIGNVNAIKIELNLMNSLVGSKNIKADFIALAKKYPEILKTIPVLIAVREKEIEIMDEQAKNITYDFNKRNLSAEDYSVFLEKTGLFDLISKHIISNLNDYVTGVETGLDSNARKNRGGSAMENLVEKYLKASGCEYYVQMSASTINKKWGINISGLSTDSKAEKKFDFVVKHRNEVFGIEVNFYASGGSKLNETARSYKMVAAESKQIDRFNFIWVTDGGGWHSARNNLKETFETMEHIYSIADLENGVLNALFKP
ncbi:type-2 restriction enzyme MjaIII [Candidatus Methanoplasma termitum]|uniref:Type-2 restriction enzyme n=1 Tax=Candidatus Methanoplasma termitum TaxID=1577791 RepID=A0A0A7LCZ6_9ARCH|nr:type II restriction endonuclease [Candidatus Methanoplasma termitum]AIZ56883.1 type-2 restriction enzyme MjaIII [Candidatus Methanoplasma termitum]